MTKKYEMFVAELKDLCRVHGVVMHVSDYDFINVHDIRSEKDLEESMENILDETREVDSESNG